MNSKVIKDIGNTGENIACDFLKKYGYEIVLRNYHSAYGEIDIIAKTEQYIIFVEVKTRKENSLVKAVEAIDFKKRDKIIKTAQHYLINTPCELQPRFDMIAVTNANVVKIEHIKNIFN